jgi:colicin import membrane protein
MIRDTYNIIPVFLAAVLHTLVLLALVFVYDFSRPVHPVVPLAISATLVTEPVQASRTPPAVERQPEPEPEPEPEPQVDLAAEQRREAEEQKRLQDLQAEQERIRREKSEEEKRKQQAEAERKKREDAERERRLVMRIETLAASSGAPGTRSCPSRMASSAPVKHGSGSDRLASASTARIASTKRT